MKEKYKNIPEELKKLNQWVCWCEDKVPRNPFTGKKAQSNNPKTWGSFEIACNAVDFFNFDGIGFMFAPPYFGVDLDHCIEKIDFVEEFVNTLDSYTEYSRSGNGIHIICKGQLPKGPKRKNDVEMYDNGRYFIFTGNIYGENIREIKDCSESIKVLRTKYLPDDDIVKENVDGSNSTQPIVKITMSDEELINRAKKSKNGELFTLLYDGKWENIYSSQSSADQAFCNILAFWTQKDKEQMNRIFVSSGLFRDKWERKTGNSTYGEITLTKAILSCTKVYEGVDTNKPIVPMDINAELVKNNYDLTDSGMGKKFRDKFLGNIKYCYTKKKWFFWSGKVWVLDDGQVIKNLADTILEDLKNEAFLEDNEDRMKFAMKMQSTVRKEALIKESQHLEGIPIKIEDFDALPNYLNCQNGVLNLKNGELIAHSREFFMTKKVIVDYDYHTPSSPLWERVVNDLTCGNKELARWLQKAVGYSLTASTKEQCMFFLYGNGNDGKSLFLNTISAVIGNYSSNMQPETIMLSKGNSNNSNTSDIARLNKVRFVACEEASEGVRLNEGLIKQLTGGSRVTCRFLFENDFEYTPEYKIWMATNHKPKIVGTDRGIWRRMRIIPCNANIPDSKIDKDLFYKLQATEYPAILKWCVDGAIMWHKEGLNDVPGVVKSAINEYRDEMDIIQSFLEECVIITNNDQDIVNSTTLFNSYNNWAKNNNEYRMSSRKFFLEIDKKLPEKKHTRNGNVFSKIALKAENIVYQFDEFQ